MDEREEQSIEEAMRNPLVGIDTETLVEEIMRRSKCAVVLTLRDDEVADEEIAYGRYDGGKYAALGLVNACAAHILKSLE